jgi:hypothetical protein
LLLVVIIQQEFYLDGATVFLGLASSLWAALFYLFSGR